MAHSEAATVAAIRECRDQIASMCSPLSVSQWKAPTALPGWDVQDVVAHLGSLDGLLLGRAEPPHDGVAPASPWVRNPLGELNEALVDRRRAWSPAEVLAEFRETSELRLQHLEALTEADLEVDVAAPSGGTVPQRRFLGIRLWDFVVHELDIAEALGDEARVDSPGATRVLDEMTFLLPRALGKARAAEGTAVLIEFDTPGRVMAARVVNGRAVLADVAAEEAALHLRASPAAFLRVATGRQDPASAVEGGGVAVTGDPHLAVAVLMGFNVVP
jgi:uncharacterized protein (TIGR03083 family)